MANYSALLCLTLVLLCHAYGGLASSGEFGAATSREFGAAGQRQQQQTQCRFRNLNPLEPSRRFQYEAGVTEEWDHNNEQLQCAGVAATRCFVQPRGLVLPQFNNAPSLFYVVQGQGILGITFPGCAETFESFQLSEDASHSQSRFRDRHQKIRRFRQGDIFALPAGVAYWFYNDANDQFVVMGVHDTNNNDNQLDQNFRRFFLAGNPQKQPFSATLYQQQPSGNNIFRGFDAEILAEAFGVHLETARRLQSENDKRGSIVRVKEGLELIRPRAFEEEEEREFERGPINGLEETFCTMRLRENIDDPQRADVFSSRGGRISALNSHNLPILRNLQLSAERGVLYKNALVAPHWHTNANSIMYVTRGSGRVEIVGESERAAFDGEVRAGQLLVIPQGFAVVKKAGNQGLEWVSFKTNDLAKTSPLAGRTSVLRAMPADVLANAFRISRDEARRLKFNRQEVTVLSPRFHGSPREGANSAWAIV